MPINDMPPRLKAEGGADLDALTSTIHHYLALAWEEEWKDKFGPEYPKDHKIDAPFIAYKVRSRVPLERMASRIALSKRFVLKMKLAMKSIFSASILIARYSLTYFIKQQGMQINWLMSLKTF